MIIEEIKISEVKLNPNNPRIVKDEKFEKLVQSIKDFPEMLRIRPIVVNSDMITLGGNMRLKACKAAGLKKVFIIRAENLNEDQQREFIIKDNIGYGEWEWNLLKSEWDKNELNEWGIEIPSWLTDHEANNLSDEDIDLNEEFDPIGISKGFQRVVFIFDGKQEAESYLNNLNIKYEKRNMAWQVNLTTTQYI